MLIFTGYTDKSNQFMVKNDGHHEKLAVPNWATSELIEI